MYICENALNWMRIKDIIDIPSEKLSSGFSAALRICKKIKGSANSDDVIDVSSPAVLLVLLRAIIRYENGIQPYSSEQLIEGLKLAGVVLS